VEKHLEERRQSQAIQNVKTKTGALAMLRGFSRGASGVNPISEDTEAKSAEKEDLVFPPLNQKSQNSFAVGGKIVRLSKAATTGRISVPVQEFKLPIKQFELPNVATGTGSEEKTQTTSPINKQQPPQQQAPDKFTALSDVPTPRSSRGVEPKGPKGDTVESYQVAGDGDGYEAQSEAEDKREDTIHQKTLTQTRNRSKSDEPPKRQISAPLRSSLIAMEPLASIPSDSDVVSGFQNHSGEPNKHWNVSDMEEEGGEEGN
jgi:hypothetical protein